MTVRKVSIKKPVRGVCKYVILVNAESYTSPAQAVTPAVTPGQ